MEDDDGHRRQQQQQQQQQQQRQQRAGHHATTTAAASTSSAATSAMTPPPPSATATSSTLPHSSSYLGNTIFNDGLGLGSTSGSIPLSVAYTATPLLTDSFKQAARSVSQLYKESMQMSKRCYLQGYNLALQVKFASLLACWSSSPLSIRSHIIICFTQDLIQYMTAVEDAGTKTLNVDTFIEFLKSKVTQIVNTAEFMESTATTTTTTTTNTSNTAHPNVSLQKLCLNVMYILCLMMLSFYMVKSEQFECHVILAFPFTKFISTSDENCQVVHSHLVLFYCSCSIYFTVCTFSDKQCKWRSCAFNGIIDSNDDDEKCSRPSLSI